MRKLFLFILAAHISFSFVACTDLGSEAESTDSAETEPETLDLGVVFDEENMPEVMDFDSFEIFAGFCNAVQTIDDDDEIWSWMMEDHAGLGFVSPIAKYHEWLDLLKAKDCPLLICDNARLKLSYFLITLNNKDCKTTREIELQYSYPSLDETAVVITVHLEDNPECESYDAIETIGDISAKCVYDEYGDYLRVYTDTAVIYVHKRDKTLDLEDALKLVSLNDLIEELIAESEDVEEDSHELIQ